MIKDELPAKTHISQILLTTKAKEIMMNTTAPIQVNSLESTSKTMYAVAIMNANPISTAATAAVQKNISPREGLIKLPRVTFEAACDNSYFFINLIINEQNSKLSFNGLVKELPYVFVVKAANIFLLPIVRHFFILFYLTSII